MKILAKLLSLVAFVTFANPQPQATRIPYSCNRTRVQAVATDPIPPMTGGGELKIKEWKICEVSKHKFKIDGILMNDSYYGRPCAGDVYIGNIAVTNMLTYLGSADTNGMFSVSVNVQTWDECSKMFESTYPGWVLCGPKDETTYAELKKRNMYLYTGRDGVALKAHKIPYEEFEQDESSVPGTALRAAPER